MKPILFHPTHRKFIKLLRKRVEVEPIYLTNEDIEAFRALVRRTNIAMERHKGLYRIFLTAMYRVVVRLRLRTTTTTDTLHKLHANRKEFTVYGIFHAYEDTYCYGSGEEDQ